MDVGQDSPTRGMGVWAVDDTAISMKEQSRYLYMMISPVAGWIVSEVDSFG